MTRATSSTGRSRRGLVGLLAVFSAGCAQNAVLEISLALPPASGRFAIVQARAADAVSFDEAWAGRDLDGLALGEGTTSDAVSLVTSDEAVMRREVGIRVRFCAAADCTGLSDDTAPEARFRIERGLYRGRVTSLALEVPTVPPAGTPTLETIGRCAVAGCTSGATRDFCTADGVHFCDE